MGRKRSFGRKGPQNQKRRKKSLVQINELAKKRIEREKGRKKRRALRSEYVPGKVKDKTQPSLDTSSDSETETSAYDELLSSLKDHGEMGHSEARGADSDDDEEVSGADDESGDDGSGRDAENNLREDNDDLSGVEDDISDDSQEEEGSPGPDDDSRVNDDTVKTEDDDSRVDDDAVKTEDEVDDDSDDAVKTGDEMDDDSDDEAAEEKGKDSRDPCFIRVHTELTDQEICPMKTEKLQKVGDLKWPELGHLTMLSNSESHVITPSISKSTEYQKLNIRKRLFDQWPSVNEGVSKKEGYEVFSPLQRELFSASSSYMDLIYPGVTHETTTEVRNVYCLHVLNHVVKNRMTVHKHNNLLTSTPGTANADDMRDQGLTRPKVLIVVPFRHTVLQIVNTIIDLLLPKGSQHVSHRKRFSEEFGDKYSGAVNPNKPEDWQNTFAGNIDDHFKMGIALSKKSLKLYTPFYQSDIIISSPLGLRTIIGSKGDPKQDFDFLSSIEILVMEQVDVFLMQNWEHVLHLLDYMHLQPKDSHGVDFSRVRMWALNGWNQFYRQTLLFSQLSCPEINAVMSKYCRNFSGQLLVCNPTVEGSIGQVATQLQQVYQRIKVDTFLSDPDERFNFFTTKVLPQYKDPLFQGTMIFIPSYFDYVRIRNYFRKEEMNFCQVCEYSQHSDISRVRQYLVKARRHFLLYTERFQFFHRIKLKAVHHIIFYQPPMYPHFYSELCNMMDRSDGATDITCQILYSKYDVQRIGRLVGSKRCSQMINSARDVHLLISGENVT